MCGTGVYSQCVKIQIYIWMQIGVNIVVLPVHVVACGAAIVNEGERVQVAGQRMS